MAKKRILFTIEVDCEIDDSICSEKEAENNLKKRISAFLYPAGMEVLAAEGHGTYPNALLPSTTKKKG